MSSMDLNDRHDDRVGQVSPQPPARMHIVSYAAIALSIVAIVFLGIRTNDLASTVSEMRDGTDKQIAKLSSQIAQTSEDSNQRLEGVARQAQESAATVEERAKSEVRRTSARLSASMAAKLAQQHQAEEQAHEQVAHDLDQLKQAGSNTETKIDAISSDVTGVKGEVASTQADLRQTGSDLKRATGDMGVMSGLIATNSTQLAELRKLGERDYLEFDIKKNGGMKKVGSIQLALNKVDPKRNRFTLNVLADDKRVEKRDKTINEPVQLYVAGNRQPYEIVVNTVKKDEVSGYLAVPKGAAPRGGATQ